MAAIVTATASMSCEDIISVVIQGVGSHEAGLRSSLYTLFLWCKLFYS